MREIQWWLAACNTSDVEDHIEERILRLEARLAMLEAPRHRPRLPEIVERTELLEDTLGTVWLSRIGILSLITGAAFLIITYFAELGPLVRAGVGYAMAGVLAWGGLRLARSHAMLGRIVFAGGLGIAYFVTYALHFVPSLRVIDSEPVGVALVAIVIAAIVAIAHRMRSETVAGIALFLALHTGMLSEVTALSLIATTLLAAGAAFFLSFNRWVFVPLSTVVAVYLTHATLASGAEVSPEIRVAFVALDFALFTVASLIGPRTSSRPLLLLGFLNWTGALVLGGAALLEMSPHVAFGGGCALATVLAGTAVIARVRKAPPELVSLSVAFALVTLALCAPLEAHGLALTAAWLALAMIAMVTARRSDARFAVISLVLVILASRVDASAIAQLACVLSMISIERWHSNDQRLSRVRVIAVAGIALGMLELSTTLTPHGFHTLGYVGVAIAMFGLGFALRVVVYRWAAFVVLVLAAGRLASHELRHFSANQRIVTFLAAGVALLAISFVYNARRRKNGAREKR
jgi:hypothetical protein